MTDDFEGRNRTMGVSNGRSDGADGNGKGFVYEWTRGFAACAIPDRSDGGIP